jgi:UDP-N-acetylmuramate dehydrogenase
MSLSIQENVPLAPLTTLKVGGPARYFVAPENEFQITEALEFAQKENLEVFVLAGGSNVVISDQGFYGLVIKIAMSRLNGQRELFKSESNIESTSNLVSMTIGAGDNWDSFVQFCVENDLAGVECLSGIPGSVGGTPVQNVGAYGQEVSETITAVRCIDAISNKPVRLTNEECRFGYRTSIFNTTEKGRFIVYDVTFQLERGGKAKVVYKDLVERFRDSEPTISDVRNAVLEIRRSKSMVIDPEDANSRSAGSFFKNPIVPKVKADEIAEKLLIPNVPNFRVNDIEVKIPAAWLIENAGFSKGFVHGNAGISSNHSLAIINRGGANANEIIEMKDMIQTAVREKFGIELQPEPIFVGF